MNETPKSHRYGIPNRTENAYEISKLKWARELAGYSQNSLARASGVNARTIRAFERGEMDINKAAAETLYKLATTLGCRMEELMNI